MKNIIKYLINKKVNYTKYKQFLDCRSFCEKLHMEKMRTDRTLNVFTLILFKSIKNDPDEEANIWMEGIAESVATCSRLTDCKGWYNKEESAVGLILSDTQPNVAETIIEKIKLDFMKRIGADYFASIEDLFKIEIYSYPTGQTKWKEYSTISQYVSDSTDLFCITLPTWKRYLDIALSLLILIVLSPMMIVVAFLIKITSKGPVFYKQNRMGFRNNSFQIYKFRTMYSRSDERMHEEHVLKLIKDNNESNKDQPLKKLANDPRVTPIGLLLRKTSIDELPQLINVLKGDMSLVGPRPCMPYEAKELTLWQKNRLMIMPGITGLWQTNGKNNTTFKDMIRYDIRYGRTINFWNDMKIIIKTPKTITTDMIDFAKSYVTEKTND